MDGRMLQTDTEEDRYHNNENEYINYSVNSKYEYRYINSTS